MVQTGENQHHIVTITIENGDIFYDPLIIMTHRGDTIEWQCSLKHGHFAVHIGYDSPLPLEKYSAPAGEIIHEEIPPEAHFGRYKYFVAVWDGEHLLTDDPEMIVRRQH